MRNKRFLIGALGLALSVFVASAAFGATATQTIDGQLGGKEKVKFDKSKFKASSVFVETTTADAADPAAVPPKATKAVIVFSKKDMKFNPKAVPGCDPNAIENTTTDAALAACGSSKVGSGTAVAALPFGTGGTRQDHPVTVTAFNRSDATGILLHSRVDDLPVTTVLKGTLAGTTLSVDIPPLAGGQGAIADFVTTVQAKDYVQARCKDKTIDFKGTFTFSDAAAASATDTQKCKQK
jgi:hypothetical protein